MIVIVVLTIDDAVDDLQYDLDHYDHNRGVDNLRYDGVDDLLKILMLTIVSTMVLIIFSTIWTIMILVLMMV